MSARARGAEQRLRRRRPSRPRAMGRRAGSSSLQEVADLQQRTRTQALVARGSVSLRRPLQTSPCAAPPLASHAPAIRPSPRAAAERSLRCAPPLPRTNRTSLVPPPYLPDKARRAMGVGCALRRVAAAARAAGAGAGALSQLGFHSSAVPAWIPACNCFHVAVQATERS